MGGKVSSKVYKEFLAQVYLCASRELSSGTAKLWVNSQFWVRKGLKQGYSVGTHPILSWGRSRIPIEVGLIRTRPLWEGLDWAFVSVHLQKRLTGLCVEVSSSPPVSWSGGHRTVKCRTVC